MMKRYLTFAFVLVVAAGLSARAADSTAGGTQAMQKVTELEQQWLDGLKKSDFALLEAILAEDFTLTGPDGKVVGRDQFIQTLKDGNLKIDSAENSEVKIRIYGDAAVATGKTTLKGNLGGSDISGDYAFTDTYIRKDGKWQEVAGQVNRLQ